jgi:serine O-acetyltransferase
MTREELQQGLPTVVDALVQSVNAHANIRHFGSVLFPNRYSVIEILRLLKELAYPGYFGKQGLTPQTISHRVWDLLNDLSGLLYEQVRISLRYRNSTASDAATTEGAARIVSQFLARLPAVRELLASDVQASVEGDPAAHDAEETIYSYPGLRAITVQRFAHELLKLDVPLLPRIMTEYAHSVTGIDIHPGAKIGRGFFIDHGTGVVIGETTEIGNNVKLYQGVTLGAFALSAPEMKKQGKKRHPTIEDDVTIFSGATILGGKTVIGRGAVISGNVFITKSVPPMHVVPAEETHPFTFEKREDVVDHYQI